MADREKVVVFKLNAGRLPVSAGVNIFDFAFADLDDVVAALDQWNKLLVMKQSGKVLWKS